MTDERLWVVAAVLEHGGHIAGILRVQPASDAVAGMVPPPGGDATREWPEHEWQDDAPDVDATVKP